MTELTQKENLTSQKGLIFFLSLLFIGGTLGSLWLLSSKNIESDSERIYSAQNPSIPEELIQRKTTIPKSDSPSTTIPPAETSALPVQVKVIIKVFPKTTRFNLKMLNPEKIDLAKGEIDEIQMMMDVGLQYQLEIESVQGQKQLLELSPAGEMEVHYVYF